MKKIFTFLLACGVSFSASSQSQRLVLVEEGSNASCGPCAAQNPGFHTLLQANTTKAVSLKYQWYFPGFDPMNEHNPDEADGRFSGYYGQNGVPTAMIDGVVPDGNNDPNFDDQWYEGAPGGYSQAMIDARYANPAQFDIDLSYTITPERITVNATATCTEQVSGNLKLRIAVIEKHISFDSAPGSNGETDFYNVMKKFLPGIGGVAMNEVYMPGETFSTEQSWNLANIYDIEEVAVVAFIQDDNDKSVKQAAFAENVPVEPEYAVDAFTSSVLGVDGFTCEGSINPQVIIQNYGSEPLTALTINYEINGTMGSVPWSGNLAFYESTTVNLGNIEFTPGGNNELTVSTSNPNGGTDENNSNNSIDVAVNIAELASLQIVVEIKTDYYPGETSWEIRDDNNALVASASYQAGTADQFGGGGPDATTTKTHDVTLQADKCYTFKLMDSFGDGMAYTGGATGVTPFGYRILSSFGQVIISEQANNFNFGEETENAMKTDETSSISGINEFTSFNVYPNPVKDLLSIELSLLKPETVNVEVIDLLGKVVKSQQFNEASTGKTIMNLNVSDLSAGVYTVRVNSDSSQSLRKITVSK